MPTRTVVDWVAPAEEPTAVATTAATGRQLNAAQSVSSYDDTAFYIRYDGADLAEPTGWAKTYTQAGNTPEAAGKLMNLRTVMAAWRNAAGTAQDMTEQDAQDNTDRFCAVLPTFRAAGVLMVSGSLEGGNPLNSDSDPDIDQTGFSYDTTNGTPSAYIKNGDGTVSLKADWQARHEQIIEAANLEGQLVELILFYQRQDYWLATEARYEAAMDTVAAWLIDKGYRNIVVNLANECGEDASSHWSGTDPWQDDAGVAGAIAYFQGLGAGQPWWPAVSASDRRLDFGPLAGAAADIILPHANLSAGQEGDGSPTTASIDALMAAWPDKPVVVDEDSPRENGNPPLADALAADELTCTRLFDRGASWGGFPSHFQRHHSDWFNDDRAPFEWAVRATADITTGTYREQATGYTRGLLDHILSLTGGLEAP